MNVYILTEGSQNIGFGHVTRCVSLYQSFEEKGIIPTLLVNGNKNIEQLLSNTNYQLINWFEKKTEIYNLVKNSDIIIIDSYLADYNFYQKISQLVKVSVYIDDNKRIDYPKGIVINGALCAEDLKYPEREGVTHLLGSRYIPMRKAFWDVPEKKIEENIMSVMITFGGNDIRNMTPGVLKCLNKNYPYLFKKIIIGNGYKNIKQIKKVIDNRTKLMFNLDSENIKKVMLETDLAISGAGQTLYELARVGVPTISIMIVNNQYNNIKGLIKAGFIEYAGFWNEESTFKKIIISIKKLIPHKVREKKSKLGKHIVDGYGSLEIVNNITNYRA